MWELAAPLWRQLSQAQRKTSQSTSKRAFCVRNQRSVELAFDTIERMARDPASGICLTSHRRMACVSYVEVKQTRNAQSQQCSGENAPMERIGSVIYLDLKNR
uniref:Uncharacterized protein n=1 Tax=Peronospora matthiolae TaxID=2874970 RepID=A0AAV1UEH5_9STRA